MLPVYNGPLHPNPLAIAYYDRLIRQTLEWRPFQGWLWEVPARHLTTQDDNGDIVEERRFVTIVRAFRPLDSIQWAAFSAEKLDRSVAPYPLRRVKAGEPLWVLAIFEIREGIWLATITEDCEPKVVPLESVRVNPGLLSYALGPVTRPIHGSARSFTASRKVLDADFKLVSTPIEGIIQRKGILFRSRTEPEGGWESIPYALLICIKRDFANSQHTFYTMVQLNVAKQSSYPELMLLEFASQLAAGAFCSDVNRMRDATHLRILG